MSRITGRRMDPNSDEHLEQSIGDIVTTATGTRCARRGYGSDVPELIDQPSNDVTRQKIFGSTALALHRWEPRARLTRVLLFMVAQGSFLLRLQGYRVDLPNRPAFDFSYPLTIA